MAGLLGEDYEDPATQGLLSAGLSMLAASGPSTKRTSVGQVLGLGGLQGMQAYQQAQKMALLKAEEERRKKEASILEQYRNAQIQELLAKAERQRRTGISPDDPNDIQTARIYMNAYNEQNPDNPIPLHVAFERTKRGSGSFNGIPLRVDKNGNVVLPDDISQFTNAATNIGRARTFGEGVGKAETEFTAGTDQQGRPAYVRNIDQLRSLGLGGGRFGNADQYPVLSNALATDYQRDVNRLPPALRAGMDGVAVPGEPGPQSSAPQPLRPPQAAAGSTKADEQFAADAVAYVTGGYQDVMTQIASLRGAKKELGSTDTATGPMIGLIPDKLLAFGNQKAVDLKDRVASVIQRSLRPILGAQFTEKEGENLVNRAYNPSLDEKYNIARLGRLTKQMEKAAEAKKSAAEYFMKNKTLAGWEGKLPTLSDFQDAIDDESLDNQPDVGEIRYTKDGRKARWDGKGWRLQ